MPSLISNLHMLHQILHLKQRISYPLLPPPRIRTRCPSSPFPLPLTSSISNPLPFNPSPLEQTLLLTSHGHLILGQLVVRSVSCHRSKNLCLQLSTSSHHPRNQTPSYRIYWKASFSTGAV